MIPVWMVVTLSPTAIGVLKMNQKEIPLWCTMLLMLCWFGWVFSFFLSWFINTVVYVWDMGIPFQLPLLWSYHSLSNRAPKVVAAVGGAHASKGRCSGTLLSISHCPTI